MADDQGFALLPLGAEVRAGALRLWPPRALSLWVVLVAHENHGNRLAFPSISRMAILAGVRKGEVASELGFLEGAGYLEPATGPGGRRAWRMMYAPYPGDLEPRAWLRLNRSLVWSGTWAAMTPSARALYLTLLALSWIGRKADAEDPSWEEQDAADWGAIPFAFLPAHLMDPGELARLAGLEPRTERRARGWLLDHGLVAPTGEDQELGLILPHDPGCHAPGVLARLERDRAEAALPKGAALKAFRAAKKRMAQGKRPGVDPQAAKPIAASGHQGTGKRSWGNGNYF